MDDPNQDSSKYTCNSASCLGNYSTIYVGLTVGAVLDSAILRGKLTELVGLWPILGGDLIKDTKPWSFTCGSTVDYASRDIDQSLATYLPIRHEQNSHKPKIMESPEISAVDEKFIFDVPPNLTNSFRLRVTLLQDATLLCFGITHYISDGNDCWVVVKAFCDLLSNKPIPLFALPPDAGDIRMSDLMKVTNECTETESNFHYQTHAQNFESGIFKLAVTMWRMLLTLLAVKFGFLEELMTKFIYIPGTWVDELRSKSQGESKDCSPNIQLTRNDVIAAWYLKSVYSHQPTATFDPVDYIGIINFRRFLQPPKAGTYYIRCSVGALRCKFSVQQLKEQSVAEIARNIRLTTQQYTSTGSVHQSLRFSEDHTSKTLKLAVRGTGKLRFAVVSHWTTFDYTGLDFSGASRNGRKASVIFVNPMIVDAWNLKMIAPVAVVTKNGSGGYWIRAANTSTGWARFSESNNVESPFRTQ